MVVQWGTKEIPEQKSDWKQFEALFTLAKIPILKKWDLVNCYWPDTIAREHGESPWYLIKTQWGLIRIGWRKRVISIDWEDTGLEAPDITADNVTKDKFLIHAYGEEKALEYLKVLKYRLENKQIHPNMEYK
jgi:hypothetical protein